jgi:hypothetical protein
VVGWAASRGHLSLLLWAVELGCPYDPDSMCIIAANGGHMEVLKWARMIGCPWDKRTCAAAAEKR